MAKLSRIIKAEQRFNKPRLEVVEKVFKKRMNNPDLSKYGLIGGFYELYQPEIYFGWAVKGLIRFMDNRELRYFNIFLDTKDIYFEKNNEIVRRVAGSYWRKYKSYGINKEEYKKAYSRHRRKQRKDKSYKQYKNYNRMKYRDLRLD